MATTSKRMDASTITRRRLDLPYNETCWTSSMPYFLPHLFRSICWTSFRYEMYVPTLAGCVRAQCTWLLYDVCMTAVRRVHAVLFEESSKREFVWLIFLVTNHWSTRVANWSRSNSETAVSSSSLASIPPMPFAQNCQSILLLSHCRTSPTLRLTVSRQDYPLDWEPRTWLEPQCFHWVSNP